MTKQELIQRINDIFVNNSTGIITPADVRTILSEVVGTVPLFEDQLTFEAMLTQCVANIPKQFVVLNDEYQNDVDVPYAWTGRILLEYNISKCDRQPTL